MIRKILLISLGFSVFASAQKIENAENLAPFYDKLNKNESVTNILFIGDSHIQSGHISEYLRNKLQNKYGNAGRGTVFPYPLANSNGAVDFTAYSNQAWQTFRLVYEQDVYPQMGALGFVMGNSGNSFIEINFSDPKDSFDEVKIFNDNAMTGEDFTIFKTSQSLKNFIKPKKTILNYQVQNGDTFPEIAAKFNVITTRLVQLNGNNVRNAKAGQTIKVENVEILYDKQFEENLTSIGKGQFAENSTSFKFKNPTQEFIINMNGKKGNILHGFQFLKSTAKNGVIFNTVGVNGATYADFLKYSLQTKQLKSLNIDVLIVALGTNESLSSITKQEFKDNAKKLINIWRAENPNFPILLISPTDNKIKSAKAKEIASWIKEIAAENKTSFLDLHTKMGGTGYFQKALQRKEANADGVHFLKPGYEKQAEIIWNELIK